jgi:hypothetical protein
MSKDPIQQLLDSNNGIPRDSLVIQTEARVYQALPLGKVREIQDIVFGCATVESQVKWLLGDRVGLNGGRVRAQYRDPLIRQIADKLLFLGHKVRLGYGRIEGEKKYCKSWLIIDWDGEEEYAWVVDKWAGNTEYNLTEWRKKQAKKLGVPYVPTEY